jgi:hypothetical protein
MFEIEYWQHGMETRLKSKIGPVRPEKYTDCSMTFPEVPSCYNAFSKIFIQMHHGLWMETWCPCLRNSFWLGGVKGKENGSAH